MCFKDRKLFAAPGICFLLCSTVLQLILGSMGKHLELTFPTEKSWTS